MKDKNFTEDDIKVMVLNRPEPTDGPMKSWSVSGNKDKKWIDWGEKNNYPETLLHYATKSPITYGILNKEETRLKGNEIVFEDNGEKIDTSHPLYFTSPGVSIRKFIDNLTEDLSKLNTFCYTTNYNKGAISENFKTKISELYYIPAKTIRSGKQTKSTGKVSRYYMMPDWSLTNTLKPKSIAAFNPEKPTTSQLVYDKTSNPNDFYYSDVIWDSALNYSILDYEIGKFHLSNIRNGLSPGLIVSFPHKISPERAKLMKQKMLQEYQGSGQAGKMMLLFSQGEEVQPTITQLEVSNLDRQFETLNKTLNEKIALATGIPRILTGLETVVGLSNAGQALKLANDVWWNESLKGKQDRIVNSINEICDVSGYRRIAITRPVVNLLDYGLSDTILQSNFTVNEIRNSVGLPPIEGGDTLEKINKI